MRVRSHATRVDLGAVVQRRPARTTLLHANARNALPGADLDAARLGLGAHRLRDRAHAADRVAPRALLAVHLAEDVMQEHVGGAGRIGAREVPHHAVESEARLDGLGLEPAVEPIGPGYGEEIERIALRLDR